MDQLIALKFVLSVIEETIKSILMVKKDFNPELFRLVLKKNVYEILSDEDYTVGVEEIMKKTSISYDLGKDKYDEDISEEEEFEIEIDIPIGGIVESVMRMIGRGEVEDIYNDRDLMRDTGIIGNIWESWNPSDDFGNTSKGMVEYLLGNMG